MSVQKNLIQKITRHVHRNCTIQFVVDEHFGTSFYYVLSFWSVVKGGILFGLDLVLGFTKILVSNEIHFLHHDGQPFCILACYCFIFLACYCFFLQESKYCCVYPRKFNSSLLNSFTSSQKSIYKCTLGKLFVVIVQVKLTGLKLSMISFQPWLQPRGFR